MPTPQSRAWRWMSGAVLALGVMTSGVLAHHGWTQYDEKKTVTVTGTITEASYSNPHASIRLEAEGDKGKTWRAVLAPPSRMKTRGLSPEMLQNGVTATIVGYPHRQQADEMRAERITIEGKTIELR